MIEYHLNYTSDLSKLQAENEDWTKTAKILMSKLMNESIEHLFPPKVEEKKESKSVTLAVPMDQEYVDQEKLVRPGEEAQEGEVSHVSP